MIKHLQKIAFLFEASKRITVDRDRVLQKNITRTFDNL